MEEYVGTCRFCGQTAVVKAENEEEAERIATMQCSCPGGEMMETLDQLIGEQSPQYGWDPVTPEAFETIEGLAISIATGMIDAATISISNTKLKIVNKAKKIQIERAMSVRQGGTIEK